MDAPEITDAARLAADAPPPGVVSPREAHFGTAWLDLRDRRTGVAVQDTARVVQALAPSLVLSEEACLFISSGASTGRLLAGMAAAALCSAAQHEALIAVVRGDDVFSRLEEFALADAESLGERWQSAGYAWAIPPASVLREAIEQNAAITLSRAADRGVIQTLEGDRDAPAGRIVMRIVTGRRLAVFLPVDQESLRREAQRYAPDDCDWSLTPCADGATLVVESSNAESLRDFSERLALVLPETPTPLSNLTVSRYDEVVVQVDPDLLEFGLDTRPASEWVDV